MEVLKISRPIDVSEAWWKEVCKKVKNAVVFIEDSVAESLHWSGGLNRLVMAGAKDVKELSAFELCEKKDEKAVFLLGGLFIGVVADTVRDIIKSSTLKYVIVVTGAHPSVHAYATYGGRDVDERTVMNKLEQSILTWMGNTNYTVEIFYYPLILVPATEELFLLPQFFDLYPLLDDDIPHIAKLHHELAKGDKKNLESLDDVEFHQLPFKLRIFIYHFIVYFHSFLQVLNAREEIFSLGHTAHIIASELDTYLPARQRRKTAPNKVSLVLVDRTLDLVSPTSNCSDTFMSRIMSLLPRLPGHKIDSAVNISPLCSVHPSCEWTLVPGCFAHPTEPEAKTVFDATMNCSKKEVVRELNKQVASVGKLKQSDGSHVSVDSASNNDQVLKSILHLASLENSFNEHFGLIQQGLAISETLKHSQNTHVDQLYSMEKMFLQALSDPHETPPLQEIIQLLNTRQSRKVTVEDILVLLVHVSSLGGKFAFEESSRYALTNSLSQAILEDKENLSETIHEIVGEEIDEVSALKTANRIWGRLQAISNSRNHLKDYRSLYGRKSDMEPNEYKSLLSQLASDCLTPPPTQLNDLEYKSAGFKDIIKTGFSLFVNVSRPKPRDAALILIYVIGGVTPAEASNLKRIIQQSNPTCSVLISSSHLTYPSDAIQHGLQENILLKPY